LTSITNPIDEVAGNWVVRQAEGPLTELEQAELEAWMAADSRHRGAFLRLQAIQSEVQRLAAVSGERDLRPMRPSSGVFWSYASAAGVVLALVGTASWVIWGAHDRRYVSDLGEVRRVALLDGSNMTLDTDSETRVHFDKTLRSVELRRGEALFEVGRDPSRPFIVEAGGTRIRALGTAFVVRVDDVQVSVTVTEGSVEIDRDGEAPRRLSTNERISDVQGPDAFVQTLKPVETERSLAWRQGLLSFAGEPLANAVVEINRYNRRHIVVSDPVIAAQSIVGVFRATDVESFARTAAAITRSHVVAQGDVIKLVPNTAQQ